MLATGVIIYLILSVLAGLFAAKKVKSGQDFILAGRSLPFHITTAALFATWFGSETVLGAGTEMAKKGIYGVISDPFGASLCLILLGLFFAKKMYALNVSTFGDFYRIKFGKSAELIASLFLVITYIGWIAGQFQALGVILTSIIGMNYYVAIIIGALIVVSYTFLGGMWSVSFTDFIQTILIIVGMGLVLFYVMQKSNIKEIINAAPKGHFDFFRKGGITTQLNYLAMWITIGLGSLPQQDLFQRVNSAKSEKVAVRSAIWAGIMYLTIALIPLILALYAAHYKGYHFDENSQLLLTDMIIQTSPIWVQIVFFGALLSAVMSTASGALLAPATVVSQNLLKQYSYKNGKDNTLKITRLAILGIALISFYFSLTGESIYVLVEESNALSLVSLFIPMLFGMYFKSTSKEGAIGAMITGFIAWISAKLIGTEINELMFGLIGSIIGMIIFQYLGKLKSST